jgi:Xaa-Pro dipeptidase
MINNNRKEKIFNICNKKIDAIFIKNNIEPYIDNNFFYFTGLDEGIFENCCIILFPEKKKSELIISELEFESSKKSKDNLNIFNTKKKYEELIKDLLSSSKFIGLNYNTLLFNDYINLKKLLPNAEFINISEEISKLRVIKDKSEILRIKKACKIVDKVMEKIPNLIYKEITENQLAAEIDYLIQKNGAKKAAFTTISSFGKNTAEPHYSHGQTKLKYGDFIICDFGANFRRYNSDITRTFIFGKPNNKQLLMHKTILNAQKIAFDEINIDIKANKIHKKVHSYIEKTEFKSLFVHSTGHSIGLNVHDVGAGLTQDCEILLKENMVFTVEPGIYLPNFGGVRIEDDILVKENGFELLTNSKRNLIEI